MLFLFTTGLRCCGISVIQAPDTKKTPDLLTYLRVILVVDLKFYAHISRSTIYNLALPSIATGYVRHSVSTHTQDQPNWKLELFANIDDDHSINGAILSRSL